MIIPEVSHHSLSSQSSSVIQPGSGVVVGVVVVTVVVGSGVVVDVVGLAVDPTHSTTSGQSQTGPSSP